MKKTIHPAAIVGIIVVVLALAGFVFMKAGGGPTEFKPVEGSKTIPNYVWDKLPPDQQAKMKSEGYTPGDVKPTGQPSGAPAKH